MSDQTFKTIYWGEDNSTEVVFEPIQDLPPTELITACSVFALCGNDSIVMSRPARGWGLPGGHREGIETAEECIHREADEEASITLGDLRLIGRWATRKKFHSPHNHKYPDNAYQLLYMANVEILNDFTPQFEVFERAIVPLRKVKDYHHDFANFSQIVDYLHKIQRTDP